MLHPKLASSFLAIFLVHIKDYSMSIRSVRAWIQFSTLDMDDSIQLYKWPAFAGNYTGAPKMNTSNTKHVFEAQFLGENNIYAYKMQWPMSEQIFFTNNVGDHSGPSSLETSKKTHPASHRSRRRFCLCLPRRAKPIQQKIYGTGTGSTNSQTWN